MSDYPTPSLVVLAGTPGSGKSSYAAAHFAEYEIVAFDSYTQIVGDGVRHSDWHAREVMQHVIASRCQLRRRTCVDATNLTFPSRKRLLDVGAAYDVPVYLAILTAQPSTIRQRDTWHSERIHRACAVKLERTLATAHAEGFERVTVIPTD